MKPFAETLKSVAAAVAAAMLAGNVLAAGGPDSNTPGLEPLAWLLAWFF